MAVRPNRKSVAYGGTGPFTNAGTPSASTHVGAGVGALLQDTTNKRLYVNTGSTSTPSWLYVGGPRVVEAHTADDTLTAAESGSVHTSVGAAGTVVLTLPAATVGLEFRFYVGAAQELRIDPNGSETISLPSTGVPGAAGKYLTANAAGETVHLVCAVAGSWAVYGYTGTWGAEA
jgi:hypothetical protein